MEMVAKAPQPEGAVPGWRDRARGTRARTADHLVVAVQLRSEAVVSVAASATVGERRRSHDREKRGRRQRGDDYELAHAPASPRLSFGSTVVARLRFSRPPDAARRAPRSPRRWLGLRVARRCACPSRARASAHAAP